MSLFRDLRGWTWAHRLTAAAFAALLVLGPRLDFELIGGTLAGTTALGVLPFVDPLVALEVTLASRTPMLEPLVGAGLLLALAALLGPVFCGWLCPLGLALELWCSLRQLVERPLRKLGIRLPSPALPRRTKFALLLGLLGFSLVGRLPLFAALSPISLISRALVFGSDLGLAVLGAIALLELISPRAWCRSLCPLGALYALTGRWSLLRIRVDPNAAEKLRCRSCEKICQLGIPVMSEFTLADRPSVDHPDCTRCGSCTEACPTGVLYLGLHNAARSD